MDMEPQLILVDASVLPGVFFKVLEAKKLLSKGIAKSSTEACRMVDVSRSAYYKYKDCVFLYEEKTTKKTITLYLRLSDEPGMLSSVLSVFHRHHANVLTVNQNLPVDGVADVTITTRVNEKKTNLTELRQDLRKISGVVESKQI